MQEVRTLGSIVAEVLIEHVLKKPLDGILVPINFDSKSFIYDLTTNNFDIPKEELDRAKRVLDKAITQGDDSRVAAGRAYSYLSAHFDKDEEDPDEG